MPSISLPDGFDPRSAPIPLPANQKVTTTLGENKKRPFPLAIPPPFRCSTTGNVHPQCLQRESYRDITRSCIGRRSLRNSLRCNRPSSSCWPTYRPASTTNLRLTFTGRAGNTAQLANTPESPASKSSDVSSRPSKSPRAWASTVTFARGSNLLRIGN
jgi:hypothetical protein